MRFIVMFSMLKKHCCPDCGKKYRRLEHLMHHQVLVHEVSKPYDCSNCGKNFGDMDLLKAHIRKDHSLKRKSESN
jgi:uncharacterized Zn-finger protein